MNKKKEYIKFCPHCGNKATQEIVYTHRVMENSFTMDGELSDSDLPCEYNVTVCKTCYGLLLYLIEGDYPGDNGLNYSYLLWPEFGINENEVPKTVLNCYKEALLVKERSPSSFAVQIRRALEAICDDKGVKKGNLNRRMKKLFELGEFPTTIMSIADKLRLIGNIGAHKAKQEVKPGFVRTIDDFFKVIIEYVYIAPKKLENFKNAVEKIQDK